MLLFFLSFFSFNYPATPAIYTLSLHDALPIFRDQRGRPPRPRRAGARGVRLPDAGRAGDHRRARPRAHRAARVLGRGSVKRRSEEHTSELQSRRDLVCRLLLEKKKKKKKQK